MCSSTSSMDSNRTSLLNTLTCPEAVVSSILSTISVDSRSISANDNSVPSDTCEDRLRLVTDLAGSAALVGRVRRKMKTDPSSPTEMRVSAVGDSRMPTTAEVWAWCSLWVGVGVGVGVG